jgi:aminopeptidase N
MDLYFRRHDGEAATVEQFIKCFADAAGRDMTQFMRWYSQAGTPEVTVSGHYDVATKTYTLDCAQTLAPTPGEPDKKPMVIPLAFGLVGKDGRDLNSGVLEFAEQKQTFTFPNISEKPVVSINRGFSAPIKLNTDLDAAALTFLAAHDSDPFNRWQALQTISTRLLVENVNAIRAGKAPRTGDGLLSALAAILDDKKLESAFVALAFVPPGETDIAREIGRDIDPDAIFAARSTLRAEIGEKLGPALLKAYETLKVSGPYSPDAASAGRRALRNVALDLLAATGRPDAIARAANQYAAADNMTDRFMALATLSLHPGRESAAALGDFYERFASDALVIDKWFALQATAPHPDTLAAVQKLATHPAFSMNNPNRVRSLIGAFAGNVTQFHRADGAGYRFVADRIIELDPKNPQVAARLATAFRTWRTMEQGRRAHAEAALNAIKAAANLSRDVSEIVERTLAPA